MLQFLKNSIKQVPAIKQLIEDIEQLQRENEKLKAGFKFAEPGHFNSPIPDFHEILKNESRFWGQLPDSLPGIDLNEDEQLSIAKSFETYRTEFPFLKNDNSSFRYYFDNPAFGIEAGFYLYAMIRQLQPKRIIEAGSGFSSCLMLDVNELYFDDSIDLTFIEPFPDLLKSKLKKEDLERISFYEKDLQDIDLDVFAKLETNDILFIDSTHVAKIGSDVNYILFEILPILNPGVYIHFHDVAYPFEYPKKWIQEGRAWNEAYMLRAFLQYNRQFKITLFSSWLSKKHPKQIEKLALPLENMGGSIWLQKL